jgi:3-methyl-2-oxobutanoate hydroxymethyltransferase
MTNPPERKKTTTLTLRQKKARGEPISMLTAYDYATALALDRAGIDSILVGDSLGMVVLGYANTLPVTMQDMLHHCRAVARGAQHALLIGDMPFMSYQASVDEAVRNAGRFLQEAVMDAVKLEGGRERAEAVRGIVGAGIPVQGHLGLTPQSVHQLGGFRSQGKTAAAAQRLIEDAEILQEAGCFSLVLEAIPARLARLVSERLEIPTIGIGAGVGCDGRCWSPDLLGCSIASAALREEITSARRGGSAFGACRAEVGRVSSRGPQRGDARGRLERPATAAELRQGRLRTPWATRC